MSFQLHTAPSPTPNPTPFPVRTASFSTAWTPYIIVNHTVPLRSHRRRSRRPCRRHRHPRRCQVLTLIAVVLINVVVCCCSAVPNTVPNAVAGTLFVSCKSHLHHVLCLYVCMCVIDATTHTSAYARHVGAVQCVWSM